MLRMLDLVAQVAPSRSTILITGETGTGKELIAKAIHANSPRADQHVRGGEQRLAAAGSAGIHAVRPRERRLHQRDRRRKKGYFEVANRGTIFFDEIGTIGPETQTKLLRVIQESEFMPLGSTEPSRWTCASWPPPTPTCRSWSKKASSARISTTG